MTVKCEIKKCGAEKPRSQMRVRRDRGMVRFRCKSHYNVDNFVSNHLHSTRKCRFCRQDKKRLDLEPYSTRHYRCKDKETCAKSCSSTTSI